MFIIVAHNNNMPRKDINSFDILSEPSGRCLTFTSKGEALTFLYEMKSESDWNESYMEDSNIRIDRLH